MKYELHITNTAERDMLSIVDYIDFVLLNPSAADALFQEADKKINELADNPEIYALFDDPILKRWGLRFVSVKNYMAFYTVSEADRIVYIIRFLYGKRDWINILRTSLPIQHDLGEFT